MICSHPSSSDDRISSPDGPRVPSTVRQRRRPSRLPIGIGVSHVATEALGDIVHVDLPAVGSQLRNGADT